MKHVMLALAVLVLIVSASTVSASTVILSDSFETRNGDRHVGGNALVGTGYLVAYTGGYVYWDNIYVKAGSNITITFTVSTQYNATLDVAVIDTSTPLCNLYFKVGADGYSGCIAGYKTVGVSNETKAVTVTFNLDKYNANVVLIYAGFAPDGLVIDNVKAYADFPVENHVISDTGKAVLLLAAGLFLFIILLAISAGRRRVVIVE